MSGQQYYQEVTPNITDPSLVPESHRPPAETTAAPKPITTAEPEKGIIHSICTNKYLVAIIILIIVIIIVVAIIVYNGSAEEQPLPSPPPLPTPPPPGPPPPQLNDLVEMLRASKAPETPPTPIDNIQEALPPESDPGAKSRDEIMTLLSSPPPLVEDYSLADAEEQSADTTEPESTEAPNPSGGQCTALLAEGRQCKNRARGNGKCARHSS